MVAQRFNHRGRFMAWVLAMGRLTGWGVIMGVPSPDGIEVPQDGLSPPRVGAVFLYSPTPMMLFETPANYTSALAPVMYAR